MSKTIKYTNIDRYKQLLISGGLELNKALLYTVIIVALIGIGFLLYNQNITRTGLPVAGGIAKKSEPSVPSVPIQYVDLYCGKKYPTDLDDNDSSDDPWQADCEFRNGKLINFSIKNYALKWNNQNPIYVFNKEQCLTNACYDDEGEAVFLEDENSSTIGYEYSKVRWDGFLYTDDNYYGGLAIGDLNIGNAYVQFKDSTYYWHNIPMYFKGTLSSTQQVWEIDQQNIYYRCNVYDTNAAINSGDVFNGMELYFTITEDENGTVIIIINGTEARVGETIDIYGITAKFEGIVGDENTAYFLFDGNCQFAREPFSVASDSDYIGTENIYNTWFYDDGNYMGEDGSVAYDAATINLSGPGTNDQTYRYAYYVSDEETYGNVWLLLDSDTVFNLLYNNKLKLKGTDTTENMQINQTYYLPDDEEFFADNADDDYYIAIFSIGPSDYYDADIYIDTTTGSGEGSLILLPNNNLSNYNSVVDYSAPTGYSWSLSTQQGRLKAGYTEFGSKYWIDDNNMFKAKIPEERAKIKLEVFGPEDGELFTDNNKYLDSNALHTEYYLQLTKDDFPSMYDEMTSYKYNGNYYYTNMKEIIGIEADARFDKIIIVGDLVLYMRNIGNFKYTVDLGDGLPGEFVNDENDNIWVPFFGELYKVYIIDGNATYPHIRLGKPLLSQK